MTDFIPHEQLLDQMPPGGGEFAGAIVLGNPDLPIAKKRIEIETSLVENTVTVINSTTGSGKSTQIGQIVEELCMRGLLDVGQCIITQPTVLAAMNLSERITDEMKQAGVTQPLVGFFTQPISSEQPQRYQNTAVLTEGKAAMQLSHGIYKDPNKLQILVIDEVHKFGKFTELLLAIAKRKTDPRSPYYDENLRVVVMSATLDAPGMLNYFDHTTTGYIEVEVPTFEVTKETTTETAAKAALKLAREAQERGLENSVVLTFMAGKGEIRSAQAAIDAMQLGIDPADRIAVIPLHAQQNAEEQGLAFKKYKNGVIVLTTNVAETSITVPYAIAVVDAGEIRVSKARFDLVPTGSEELNLELNTRSSMDQRKGRAGRTQVGVYVLAKQMGGTPTPYEHHFRFDYPKAAIEIEAVDDLLLFVKANECELSDFDFYHKIPRKAINAANKKLYILGALDAEGCITERGKFMETLPLNPEFACMVAYAQERGFNNDVQQNIMDIVAIMQRGGIFSRSPKEQGWRQLLERDPISGEVVENVSDYIAQLEGYVELIKHPVETWGRFDVNVYAAELIRTRRESLARALGITNPGPIVCVDPKNREAVLSCIYAGQLAQLWQRNSSTWSLLNDSKVDYRPHPNSVAGLVGRYATGELFSVGTYGKYEHSLQDINRVPNTEILADVATHLVTETDIPGTERYIAEKQAVVVSVQRRLGTLILKEGTRIVEIGMTDPSTGHLASLYTEHIVKQYIEGVVDDGRGSHHLLRYKPDELDDLIKEPETQLIGTNIYSGEPIYVYLGADMRPMLSKEIARESLRAQKARLQKAPARAEHFELKSLIKVTLPEVRNIKSVGNAVLAAKAKELLKGPNTYERLEAMRLLIEEWKKTI